VLIKITVDWASRDAANVRRGVHWHHRLQAVSESIRSHHREDHQGCAATPLGPRRTEEGNLQTPQPEK
jgi:hypothetical protein